MPVSCPRARGLDRLIARADWLLDRAARVSTRFTRWRLAIVATGVLAAVVPFKLGWYHGGNAALGLFLVTFLIVAQYHTRLENRMHRLRLWRGIEHTHRARLRLDWCIASTCGTSHRSAGRSRSITRSTWPP